MTTASVASIALLGCALLMVGLGVPLILGKVERNRWYGFRTPATLSSDEIWYPANRSMGWGMFWNGLIMALLVCASLIGVSGCSLLLVLLYMPLATAVMLAMGFRRIAQLQSSAPR